jgi:hypothetical protein
MSIHENHPCHIVNKRPWLLTGAIGAIVTLIELIKLFQQYDDRLLGILKPSSGGSYKPPEDGFKKRFDLS